MDKVSVIVPVYKVEKYLHKCMDSILAQTYTELEILLVDDGSPDNCPAICDEYAQKDGRIRVIHKKNGGLSDARNAALDVMTGRYVTFVDSDDYIPPDAVETLYNALIENDADLAVGNLASVSEAGEINEMYTPARELTVLEGDGILSTLNQPCAPVKLYKKEIFDELRYPVGRLYEDLFVYHKVLSRVNRCVLTGKVAYYYLIRSGSIMHSEYDIRFTDVIFALKDRYNWLDSIGQDKLADEAALFIYSRAAVAFAHLDKADPVHAEKLREVKKIYDGLWKRLLTADGVSAKQKLRLVMLKYMPGLHSKLFGRKMPLALG